MSDDPRFSPEQMGIEQVQDVEIIAGGVGLLDKEDSLLHETPHQNEHAEGHVCSPDCGCNAEEANELAAGLLDDLERSSETASVAEEAGRSAGESAFTERASKVQHETPHQNEHAEGHVCSPDCGCNAEEANELAAGLLDDLERSSETASVAEEAGRSAGESAFTERASKVQHETPHQNEHAEGHVCSPDCGCNAEEANELAAGLLDDLERSSKVATPTEEAEHPTERPEVVDRAQEERVLQDISEENQAEETRVAHEHMAKPESREPIELEPQELLATERGQRAIEAAEEQYRQRQYAELEATNQTDTSSEASSTPTAEDERSEGVFSEVNSPTLEDVSTEGSSVFAAEISDRIFDINASTDSEYVSSLLDEVTAEATADIDDLGQENRTLAEYATDLGITEVSVSAHGSTEEYTSTQGDETEIESEDDGIFISELVSTLNTDLDSDQVNQAPSPKVASFDAAEVGVYDFSEAETPTQFDEAERADDSKTAIAKEMTYSLAQQKNSYAATEIDGVQDIFEKVLEGATRTSQEKESLLTEVESAVNEVLELVSSGEKTFFTDDESKAEFLVKIEMLGSKLGMESGDLLNQLGLDINQLENPQQMMDILHGLKRLISVEKSSEFSLGKTKSQTSRSLQKRKFYAIGSMVLALTR